MGQNFSILIEGYGRYCKVDGLKGDGNVVRSNGTSTAVFGVSLYYYEWKDFITTQAWYADINLLEAPQSGENNRNVRDALVDLSGIAFRTGIRISL